ncbi:MSHA biogenesis protein MshF [Vibrio vulnificus]|uniref:MSHA biogenesis protein MshF n=1 Tax=Vibrio vulnificus TaxID=672 RepID=UPI0009B64701|nr:MSHA biogenesis protein MshF [Vibrio vulnificus]EHZ2847730.1 MSHA biogenesis protein MshF [Vibrio vulnificus]ELI9682592.1 MSHA biogenesis protein MshF [Vibrio vulnificus]ELP5730132.1 MSHA biogenesis protein MshF [Vibrio vulnificus]OQK48371.1 MSHA biogenesis protein MshF [Vibrio vulnificus]
MGRETNRASLVFWLLLVVALFAVFAQVWQPVESEASKAASEVSVKRMLERANLYKQEWLLQGKPKQLEMEGEQISISAYGWVPLKDESGQFQCQSWLDLHFPERRILEFHLLSIDEREINDDYQCRFTYQGGFLVVVTQQRKVLKISVEKMTE